MYRGKVKTLLLNCTYVKIILKPVVVFQKKASVSKMNNYI